MRFTDLLLDLNDIWGRIIPGLFIMGDLYLALHLIRPLDHLEILSSLTEQAFLSWIFLFIILFLSPILGELSLYPAFKLRWLLPMKTPKEILKAIDVTKNRDLLTFYEERFSEEELTSTRSLLVVYCKDFLLQECRPAYVQARKIEARINFRGGMIFPLLALAVLSLIAGLWIAFFLSAAIFTIFFDDFRRSPGEVEDAFLLRAYYNCNLSSRSHEEGAESPPHNKGFEPEASQAPRRSTRSLNGS